MAFGGLLNNSEIPNSETLGIVSDEYVGVKYNFTYVQCVLWHYSSTRLSVDKNCIILTGDELAMRNSWLALPGWAYDRV